MNGSHSVESKSPQGRGFYSSTGPPVGAADGVDAALPQSLSGLLKAPNRANGYAVQQLNPSDVSGLLAGSRSNRRPAPPPAADPSEMSGLLAGSRNGKHTDSGYRSPASPSDISGMLGRQPLPPQTDSSEVSQILNGRSRHAVPHSEGLSDEGSKIIPAPGMNLDSGPNSESSQLLKAPVQQYAPPNQGDLQDVRHSEAWQQHAPANHARPGDDSHHAMAQWNFPNPAQPTTAAPQPNIPATLTPGSFPSIPQLTPGSFPSIPQLPPGSFPSIPQVVQAPEYIPPYGMASGSGPASQIESPGPRVVQDSSPVIRLPNPDQKGHNIPQTAPQDANTATDVDTAVSSQSSVTSRVSAEELASRQNLRIALDRLKSASAAATQALLKEQTAIPQKPPRLLSKLIDRLDAVKAKDHEEIVRRLRAIGKTHSPSAIEVLQLYSERKQVPIRRCCAECLGGIQHARAAVALIAMVTDSSTDVSDEAVLALLKLGNPVTIPVVLAFALISTRNRSVVHDLIVNLKTDEQAALNRPLQDLLRRKDVDVAALAIALLARTTGSEHFQTFVRFLKHPEPQIRAAALDALVQTGEKQSVRFLNAAITDTNAGVRAVAAAGMGKISSPRSCSLLCEALKDSDVSVRRAVARTLCHFEDKSIGPVVSRHLKKETDPDVIEHLLEIAGKSGAEEALITLRRFLEGDDLQLKYRAISALRRLKNPKAAGMLAPILNEHDEKSRRLAVEAVGYLGQKNVVPRLRELLKSDPEESVRAAAARALGELKDRESIRLLEESLYDSRSVRSQAIIALGQIGDKSSLPAILAQLRDQAPEVRYHACNALGDMGEASAVSSLVKLLDDHEPMVKRAADSALEKLGGGPSRIQLLSKRCTQLVGRVGSAIIPSSMVGMLPGGTKGLFAVSAVLVVGIVGFFGMGLVGSLGTPGSDLPVTRVTAVAVTSTGDIAFAGRSNGVGEFWDLKEGKLLDRFKSPYTKAALFNKAGDTVLMFSVDAAIRHKISDRYRESVEDSKTTFGSVMGYYFPPEGDTVWVSTKDGKGTKLIEIRLDSLEHGKTKTVAFPIEGQFALNQDQSMMVTPAPDGLWLYTGDSLKRADKPLPMEILVGKELAAESVRDVCFNSDGSLLAIAMQSTVVVLELPSGNVRKLLFSDITKGAQLTRVKFIDTKNTLVSVGGAARRFEASRDFQTISATDGPKSGVMSYNGLTPDFSTAVYCEDEGKDLILASLKDSKVVHTLKAKLDDK
ncbi:MAG: HEAT repeat domain-containing protein [Planctomycetaceae bacterium]